MDVRNRKIMLVYKEASMLPGRQGTCGCGHQLEENERFMAYPCDDGMHEFVCLTCHFWNVEKAAS